MSAIFNRVDEKLIIAIPPSSVGSATAIPVQKPGRAPRKPKLELVDAQNAAHNIITTHKRGRFSENELVDLLQLLAEGTSERRIINFFRNRYNRAISAHTIKEYRGKYVGRIMEIAHDLELLAIEAGLTKRFQRLLKLQELAEAIEVSIYNVDGELKEKASAKMIDEYRAVLAQIAQETGDLQAVNLGDINFVGMTNDQLKALAANKLAAHKDLAISLAERAGIRPQRPEEKEEVNDRESRIRHAIRSDDVTNSGDPSELREGD